MRYILICTNNHDHQGFVAWTQATDIYRAAFLNLKPQHYLKKHFLKKRPTSEQLKRYRCQECGATMTLQEVE